MNILIELKLNWNLIKSPFKLIFKARRNKYRWVYVLMSIEKTY